jgi:RNA polymerase sigma-70 factor (ECF subfamily)
MLSDLYSLHWKRLCRYVRTRFGAGPPEPEDVAQAAFARFAGAHAGEILNAEAFLYTTARNIVIDHRRHVRRSHAHDLQLAGQAENNVYDLTPEDVLLQRERFEILAQALEGMPAKHRRLVLLHRFEGLSYGELGERFGMSAENVRKHIERTVAECVRALEAAQKLRLKARGPR